MHVEHAEAKTALLAGLRGLLDVADGLDDRQLLAPSRCYGWNVGDVLVHVHLGLQELLADTTAISEAAPDIDAASYWRDHMPSTDAGADRIDAVQFVRRVAASYRRPSGLVAHLHLTADGVTRAVEALAPGAVTHHGRVMTTGDFLATWATELAVHHVDLGRELTLAPPAPAALRVARATVEALAGGKLPEDWSDETAVLLGTGRLRVDEHLSERQAGAEGPVVRRLPVLG